MKRLLAVLVGVSAWAEFVHWRASRTLVNAPAPARTEAVVVLGFRNRGAHRANALNRWRVRAALRSISLPDAVLICAGGPTSDHQIPEAVQLAAYARTECAYAGRVLLDEHSRSTWQNIENVIPLLADADRIKIVSNSLHALKARRYLRKQRSDLAARVVRGADYRFGEGLVVKPFFALYALRRFTRVKTGRPAHLAAPLH